MSGYDPKKAALFNKLIQDGLSEDAALSQAGISDPGSYVVDEVGTPETNRNYGQLTDAGFNVPGRTGNTLSESERESDPDVDRQFRTTVTNEQTITNDTVTVTGGGSKTTVVTPTQFQDTAASRSLQEQADQTAAQKAEVSAQLRAEGKSGAEVLRDPKFRELSQQQQSLQNQADSAKTPVPGTGTVTVTTANIDGDVTDVQTSTPDFVTDNAGISDPTVQTQEISETEADSLAQPQQSADEDPQAGGFVFDDNGDLIPADSAQAESVLAEQNRVENFSPEPTGGNFVETYNVETGLFDVVDLDTGEAVATGLTEQQAILQAENRSVGDPSYVGSPQPTGSGDTGEVPGVTVQSGATPETGGAIIAEVKARQSIREQLGLGANGANRGDWRVRLSLAPGSNYLYNSTDPGILRPLTKTQGVIFPYTPGIQTSYNANYEQYDLTHSNFRGYFYRNSYVGEVSITATFTAQDTREAEYLMAVIHFFRSATKMFYGGGSGQPDEFLGSPPPLVYLTGYGDYQFSGHPCVISQFTYNLPGDVDYIRAFSKNINGTSMADRADQRAITPTIPSLGSAVLSRLTAIGFGAPGSGGQSGRTPSSPSNFRPGDLGLGGSSDNPSYVPTKIDLSLTLLPMQSRQKVSQAFSLREFATGQLLKGGMW